MNLAGDELQTISITANTTFQSSNALAGRSKVVKIENNGVEHTLSFPSAWTFIGQMPTSIAASKTGVLSLTCFENNSVIASYAVEE